MPLYEYTCTKCRDEFELLVRGSETPVCPACGSDRLERLLSVPAAHVAGQASPLPVCESPRSSAGGCGAPWCGQGGCGT
ncbi:MAG: zinc ribbon domain-containing protein [Planctomycetota bacterium]|nr:MAG: zinc ribbon domain-containing protein [Planctomycetota bacterium]